MYCRPEALSKAEYQTREQPVCERIRSTKSFVERKQKRVEQAKEATEKVREAPDSAASQREEVNLLAEGERRLAELMMEEKAIPSPFQVNPVCNVNVELDHLRAEIARLRQQDGTRSRMGRQELESWMNHRAGDLRVAIEENNEKVAIDHVVGRRATAIPFVGGRRCSSGGRFLCNGTW